MALSTASIERRSPRRSSIIARKAQEIDIGNDAFRVVR
jgi:hypothetical protein